MVQKPAAILLVARPYPENPATASADMQAVQTLLQQESQWSVETAADVATTVAMASTRDPDLIIADCNAADLQHLSDAFAHLNPPPALIALTHVADLEAMREFLGLGAADVVPLPLLEDRILLRSIHRQLEATRLQHENQAYRDDLERSNRELQSNLDELKADQKAGRQVQMKMLPEHDQVINALRFDYCIKPSLYLSGDFFEYFIIDEQHCGVYFADVSGHGSSSAFVTVLLKNLCNRLKRNLRRGSSDDLYYPDHFLSRVNTELLETGLNKHLTLFYAIFDSARGLLRYAIGAQYPLPILTQNGETRFLRGKGPPVGLFHDANYQVFEENLENDFSLVLCSDGLLEVLPGTSLDEKEAELMAGVSSAGAGIAQLTAQFGLEQCMEVPDDIAVLSVSGGAHRFGG